VSSPFRDGKADVAVYFILFTGVPLATVAVLINWALRRRLGLRGWWTAAAYCSPGEPTSRWPS
jgi:hypothetical protein